MNTLIVKKPFMSREGQFEEGKHTLCVGLAVDALKSTDQYRVFLGKNRRVYYLVPTAEALRVAGEADSIWKNKEGKLVAIVPLLSFKKVEVG